MSCRDELLNLLIQKAAWRTSATEEQRIEELLDENPALWEDYREWEADRPALREAVGLATAQQAVGTPMPEDVRERLMDHMRDRFPTASKTDRTRPSRGHHRSLLALGSRPRLRPHRCISHQPEHDAKAGQKPRQQ